MTDLSLKLLKLYSKRTTLSLKGLSAIYNNSPENWCDPIAFLRDEDYLEIDPTHSVLHGDNFTLDAPFKITYKGKAALEA